MEIVEAVARPASCVWDQSEARLLLMPGVGPLTVEDLYEAEKSCPWPQDAKGAISAGVRRLLLSRLLPHLQRLLNTAAAPHGLTSSPAAFQAFEHTQDYASHRGPGWAGTRPDGVAWGGHVYVLGNLSKHFKLVSQLSDDNVSHRLFGTFQQLHTRVQVELPTTTLATWSLEHVLDGDSDTARQLLQWLKESGWCRGGRCSQGTP